MTSALTNELLQSISATIADYRQGEILPPDADHIQRWVYQFESAERFTILREMDRLLRSHYLSRSQVEGKMRQLIQQEKFFGKDLGAALQRTHFLRFSGESNSQGDLLSILDNIVRARIGQEINAHIAFPNNYIYLDDCLFSGNTALNDLRYWLPRAAPNITLHVIFLVAYSRGFHHLNREVARLAQQCRVSVQYFATRILQNDRVSGAIDERSAQVKKNALNHEAFWPHTLYGDKLSDNYLASLRERCQSKGVATTSFIPFRPVDIPARETTFSSPQARHVVESAFLKAGLRILGRCKFPKPELRPLGYERLEPLGFGAVTVTYRNVANNCPLVWWWGDSRESYPLNTWYPLFQRKTRMGSSYFGG